MTDSKNAITNSSTQESNSIFTLDVGGVTKEAIELFSEGTGIKGESSDIKVADFLCVLMHLSNDEQDFDFDECLATARTEYMDDIRQQ